MAAVIAWFPATKVRAMISFASVIFLLMVSISAFFLINSSRIALSAALSVLDVGPFPEAGATWALVVTDTAKWMNGSGYGLDVGATLDELVPE
jgi:hypothetical protein